MLATPFYAAVLGILFLVLSYRVVRARVRLGVPVGDADDLALRKAIRAHANFAEYVPFTLLLIFFLENAGAPAPYVHILLVLLVIARIVHAYGISRVDEDIRFRVAGIVVTFIVMGLAALSLAALQASRLFA